MRALFVLVIAGLCACSQSTTLLTRDSGPSDGGRPPTDTSVPADAGPDASAPDTGVRSDAGTPPSTLLGRTLSCDMTREEVLAAAVRNVACRDDRRVTVQQRIEEWEAGLFPGIHWMYWSWAGPGTSPPPYGCEEWRCAAAANSCAELSACADVTFIAEACEPARIRCDGDAMQRCTNAGDGYVPILDCAEFGATCTDGYCARPDACEIGRNFYELGCDGNELALCDLRQECPAGTTCSSFAVGGEVPVEAWCAPPGFGGAGAYATPVLCVDGRISFTSAADVAHSFDCIAEGYAGCDTSGCLR